MTLRGVDARRTIGPAVHDWLGVAGLDRDQRAVAA